MIDYRLDDDTSMKDQKDILDNQPETAEKPQSAGRRSLLKGTATALPAILTLHSGAALARTSNLISTTEYKTSRDRTLCLDLRSVEPVGPRGYKYDIGNGYADVYRIPERDYYVRGRNGSWREIDEKALCERGDSIVAAYKENGQIQKANVPIRRGGMISLTAAASMADQMIIYDISDV